MAVTFTTVNSSAGAATGVAASTGTLTAIAGTVYLVSIVMVGGNADPTCAGTNGFNVTWTRVAHQTLTGDASQRMTKFVGVAGSSVSGVITVSDASATGYEYGLIVDRCNGDGTTPHVQSLGDTGTGTSNTGPTLAAFGSAANGTHLCVYTEGDKTGSWTPEDSALGQTTLFFGVRSMFTTGDSGNDLTPSGSWTGSVAWSAIGTEIAAAAGVTITPDMWFQPASRLSHPRTEIVTSGMIGIKS